MTSIKRNHSKLDVYSHIREAYEVIEEFLPKMYVDKVLEKLPENTKITSGIIRNIRNRTNPNVSSNLEVLNALVEVALDHKKQQDKLAMLIGATEDSNT